MPITNQVESILQDELRALVGGLQSQVTDPAEMAAVVAMATDAALIPVRAARGEDVAPLVAALRAEALNRAMTHRVRAETLARDAWMRTVTRLVGAALTGLA
jgi:translation initiation factor IF-2